MNPLHGNSDSALYISKIMHRMTKKMTLLVAQGTGVQMIRNYEHDKIMTSDSNTLASTFASRNLKKVL